MFRRNLFIWICVPALAGPLLAQIGGEKQPQPAPPPPLPGTTGKAPPPMPTVDKTPSPYDSSDGVFSIAPFYWVNTADPQMRTGKAADPRSAGTNFDFPGKNKYSYGGTVGIPAGKDNTIRVSYFRMQGSGSTTSTKPLNFFGTTYDAGTYLNPHYTMENLKVSLDYTSWPFPLKARRFRFKTLWEIQYVTFKSTVSAPALEAANSSLSPAKKNNWFFYPSFGVGMGYSLSKHARFEARISAFAWPHHATLWDSEALLAYRMGPLEIFGGGKAFHFKTSPQQEEYVSATPYGGMIGIRWYPKF